MFYKNILSLCITIIFLVFLIPDQALSADKYNIGYNGGSMVVVMRDDAVNIIPRNFYGIRAIRDLTAPNQKFKLRFFSMGEVTGCAQTNDFIVTPSTKKGETQIKAKDSELSLKKDKHRYTNHDCDIERLESYFDVEFSVAEIVRNKVKTISIKSDRYGNFVNLSVDANSSRIVLSSKYPKVPGMPSVTGKMYYWLYPANTVVLFAPSAKAGQDIQSELIDFALKNNLMPITQMVPEFELSPNQNGYYYFYDHSRLLQKRIETPDNSIILGKIQLSRTVYGANGPTEEPYYLDVHATLPNADQ